MYAYIYIYIYKYIYIYIERERERDVYSFAAMWIMINIIMPRFVAAAGQSYRAYTQRVIILPITCISYIYIFLLFIILIFLFLF